MGDRNPFAVKHKDLVQFFDPTNTFNINQYIPITTNLKWLCPINCPHGVQHKYNMRLSDKASGRGCSLCNKASATPACPQCSLAGIPEIVAIWSNQNPNPITDYKPGSKKDAIFTCPQINCPGNCPHIYTMRIDNKVKGQGCPICVVGSNQVCRCNSLAGRYPNAVNVWDTVENAKLGLDCFTLAPRSNVKAHWICPVVYECGCIHKYVASIDHQTARIFANNVPNTVCHHTSDGHCQHHRQ